MASFPTNLVQNIGPTFSSAPTNFQAVFDPTDPVIRPHRKLNVSFRSSSNGLQMSYFELKLFRYYESPVRQVSSDIGADGVTILNPVVQQPNSTTAPNFQYNVIIYDIPRDFTYYLRLRTAVATPINPSAFLYNEKWIGPFVGDLMPGDLLVETNNMSVQASAFGSPQNNIKVTWGSPSQLIEIYRDSPSGTKLATPIDNLVHPNTNTTVYPLEHTFNGLEDGSYTFYVGGFGNYINTTSQEITINTTGGGGGETDFTTIFNTTSLLSADFTNATPTLKGLLDLITDGANVSTARSLMRSKMQAVSINSFKVLRDGSLFGDILSTKLAGSEIQNFSSVLHIGVISGESISLDTIDVSDNRPIYFDTDVGDTFDVVFDGTTYTFNILSSTSISINGTTYTIGNTATLGDRDLQIIGFGSVAMNPKSTPIPCFLKGTRVLTPKGYKAIEKFKDGDLIITDDNRIVPVKMSVRTVKNTTEFNAPYRIPKNFFRKGIPQLDVDISPEHAIMFRPNVWIIPRILAMATRNVKQIKLGETVNYYHLEAPEYIRDNMIVEGMTVETYGRRFKDKVAYVLSNKEGGFIRISKEKDEDSGLNINKIPKVNIE